MRLDDPDRADPAQFEIGILSHGLANRSDQVGRNLMDHVHGIGAVGNVPGFLDRYYYGRRPTGIYIPRYANVTEDGRGEYTRGWAFQGKGERPNWDRALDMAERGRGAQDGLREPGPWQMVLFGFAEMLPRRGQPRHAAWKPHRRWGMPLVHIDCTLRRERKEARRAGRQGREAMLEAAGCTDVRALFPHLSPPGTSVHEMGTARMGLDPATSVLNRHNQAHDVPNLFITDGSCMTSSGCVNPSLTYMALSARAAHYAADRLPSGEL